MDDVLPLISVADPWADRLRRERRAGAMTWAQMEILFVLQPSRDPALPLDPPDGVWATLPRCFRNSVKAMRRAVAVAREIGLVGPTERLTLHPRPEWAATRRRRPPGLVGFYPRSRRHAGPQPAIHHNT